MNKEKQIEEMAKDIRLNRQITPKPNEHPDRQLARLLFQDGYCKASEVAREIFEEIEEMLNLQAKIVCETRDKYSETDKQVLSFIAMQDGRIYSLRVVEEHIAELKKKYTEEGK